MRLKYEEDIIPFLEVFIGIKSKEWYMQRIVKFILNMTSYEGEWKKGFYHKYDIYLKDIIPNFVIFSMISDNGELLFEGHDDLSEKEITIVAMVGHSGKSRLRILSCGQMLPRRLFCNFHKYCIHEYILWEKD